MTWLLSALVALLVLSVLAMVSPAIFGPAVAGLAPLLIVIAALGIGAIWWRLSRATRVDAPGGADQDETGPEDLRGEDERPAT